MFCEVINPPLRNMDGAFAKEVDGLLRGVSKILTIFEKSSILGVLLGFEFPSVYFSFLSETTSIGSIC